MIRKTDEEKKLPARQLLQEILGKELADQVEVHLIPGATGQFPFIFKFPDSEEFAMHEYKFRMYLNGLFS